MANNHRKTIAVLGAGSWGTAVAIHLAAIGHQVLLWGHRPEQIQVMAKERCNHIYLPDSIFPNSLIPSGDLNSCIQKADEVAIAVPSQFFSSLIQLMDKPKHGLTWLTKGVDPESHQLLSVIAAQRFGADFPLAVISGPSFAKEVAQALPTALTVASKHPEYQAAIHALFHHQNIRVYLSEDMIGVQLCGAVKNILAIACGISDGLGYGANAKAALITRGLAEMTRLGIKLGAQYQTFLGLAGVGDLVVTCTDNQSRNRRFGLLVGQGVALDEAEKLIGQVVEGKHNAAQIHCIAKQHQIEMPICEQVHLLLEGEITPKNAVKNLMTRPARGENL